MEYLPIWFDLKAKPVLVVGGGDAAAPKVRHLVKAGAQVTVVAPTLNDELARLADAGTIKAQRRPFDPDDVWDMTVVYAASEDQDLDDKVSQTARYSKVPVNVVDRPELSDFIMPAIVDRDPVVIGISTAGSAPILARQIRGQIEELLPENLGPLARFTRSFRSAVAAKFTNKRDRFQFWSRFFDSKLAKDYLEHGGDLPAEEMLRMVNKPEDFQRDEGKVVLVGAGPGSADLLTLRALRLIRNADVIIFDHFIGEDILEFARRDAVRFFVREEVVDGSVSEPHGFSQDEVGQLMVQQALAGNLVVRLKGGDPFLFGRAGDEMTYLQKHGVEVHVVPGVTAAAGCAAAAHMPLTHKDYTHGVSILAASREEGFVEHDWDALVRSKQTLVFYMGVGVAAEIRDRLQGVGLNGETPAALVLHGTRENQKVLSGHLNDLAEMAKLAGPAMDGVIVIGDVARFAQGQEIAEAWQQSQIHAAE